MTATPDSHSPETAAPRLNVAALDTLTLGAFSAATSGERMTCLRNWLATEPTQDVLQQVFRELSAKDKGAAKLVRERLDEIKRSHAQAAIALEWADRARALLAQARLNVADALAWQRDAARAGAPLSREPLAALKADLVERVRVIEDLQHREQVHREAAVLLAQRIELLSTKPWGEALGVHDALQTDVLAWQAQADVLVAEAQWPSVDLRYHSQLSDARAQLRLVWEAFDAALTLAQAAATDAQAPLPAVPLWADALRSLRGQPSEVAERAQASADPAPAVDPEIKAQAKQAVREALQNLEQEMAAGHGKASAHLALALRAALREHGRWVGAELEARVNAALAAEAELEGWQRWRADQLRQGLLAQAQGLLNRPEGQALGGRKLQEQLKALREAWKATDSGGAANHALWKKFDEACNQAHQVVAQWLEQRKAQTQQNRSQRLALIDELKAWTETSAQAPEGDWRAVARALHGFAQRWRDAGHLNEKQFAELQSAWKTAFDAAQAPLEALRATSLNLRHAMIDEAVALGAAVRLDIAQVKALQGRWQQEAQRVPLERRQEQKLWDAFRKPIDEAFQRKGAEREQNRAAESAHDQAVRTAAQALNAASAAGDALAIRSAMDALQAAMRGQALAQAVEQNRADAPVQLAQTATNSVANDVPAAAVSADVSDAPATPPAPVAEPAGDPASAAPDAPAQPAPAALRKAVVAMRGDDRPGSRREAAAPAGRAAGGARGPGGRAAAGAWGERGPRDERNARGADRVGREARPAESFARGPRLGDGAFRAQRDAFEHAQAALRKLAAQAHGEALTGLLHAWAQRSAQLPSVQELGARVSPAVRTQWAQAISQPPAADAAQALLRLEVAAEVPSPAALLDARRQLQLNLLTRRHEAAPSQTWAQDAAQVLASAHSEASAQRLQRALKVLLHA